MAVPSRPPFDAEVEPILQSHPLSGLKITRDMLPHLRSAIVPDFSDILSAWPIEREDRTISGPGGDLIISILRPTATTVAKLRPGIVHFHGGGMVAGNRFAGVVSVLEYIKLYGAICITVEYRLAPEHPDPGPIEDCYATLVWANEHATELGIDKRRLMVVGTSAGGGLAAGVALLSRDRGGPALCAQLLTCPMIDDRNNSVSSQQFTEYGIWTRSSNATGWSCLLGEKAGGNDTGVSIYAAPARATDLSGLPSTFIEVGSAEIFRDENVAYASRLWACGVDAELHVWAGGFHGFDSIAPKAAVSITARQTRVAWVGRVLSKPISS